MGRQGMNEIAKRDAFTRRRVEEIRNSLTQAETYSAGNACIYATGSYGRCEASEHSDLDIFIVGTTRSDKDEYGRTIKDRSLTRLNEILIKGELIKLTRTLGYPEFSKDGAYLSFFSVHDFTETLGTENDDATNTFTARLLLLRESCSLTGEDVYFTVAKDIIEAYWRDFHDHATNFIPAFLTNDILRLWRTFCVNYEARTSRDSAEDRAQRKMKNYKLKHSRIMTCYSAILFFLSAFSKNGTVTKEDAFAMFRLAPTHRIQQLEEEANKLTKQTLQRMLDQYEHFLEVTNTPEDRLVEQFMDKSRYERLLKEGNQFGNLILAALREIGADNDYYRIIVV